MIPDLQRDLLLEFLLRPTPSGYVRWLTENELVCWSTNLPVKLLHATGLRQMETSREKHEQSRFLADAFLA